MRITTLPTRNSSLRLAPTLFLCVITTTLNSAFAATTQESKGWLLKQQHTANGQQNVYVFPEHLRIENVDIGHTVIADAKSGKVWLFSDERKVQCCVNWDKFEHTFSKIMQIGGENISKMQWTKAKDSKGPLTAGLETTKYVSSEEKLYFGGGRSGGFISGGGRKIKVDCTLYIADKIKTSPRLIKVFAEMQTTPILGGIPLQEMSFYHSRNKEKVYLKTLSAKQISDDPKLWAIPKYKLVDKPQQVTSVTDSDLIEDMIGKP